MADPAVAAKLAGKASQWTALTRELASRRCAAGTATAAAAATSSPPEVPPSEAAVSTLKMIEKLLTVNPDPAHLWNHRRELLLLPSADAPSASASADASESSTSNFALDDELKLTAACLQRNPKAYAAWFHRKWAVRHWLLTPAPAAAATSEEQRSALLQTELGQTVLDRQEEFRCEDRTAVDLAHQTVHRPEDSGPDGLVELDRSPVAERVGALTTFSEIICGHPVYRIA